MPRRKRTNTEIAAQQVLASLDKEIAQARRGVRHFPPTDTTPDGSHRKAGGVIGLPYLDGVQHAQLPMTAAADAAEET